MPQGENQGNNQKSALPGQGEGFHAWVDDQKALRMVQGEKKHGILDLKTDPRDFIYEALEEAIDFINYSEMAMAQGKLSFCKWSLVDKEARLLIWRLVGGPRRVEPEPVRWVPLRSSNINAIAYNPETKIFSVRFSNSGIYHYSGVPESIIDDMLRAESPGKYFAQNIKGKYPSQKEETPCLSSDEERIECL